MRGLLRILLWTVLGIVALVAGVVLGVQTEPGRRLLASTISQLASTPDQRLTLTGLDGVIPADFSIGELTLADRQGPWLKVEKAHVRLALAPLLDRRVQLDLLAAERVTVLRPPLPSQQPSPPSDEPFSLPVDVDLASLSIGDLHLGAALGGLDTHWKVAGAASLAEAGRRNRLSLTLDRTDGPAGRLTAELSFDLVRFSIDGKVAFDESGGGGLVAAMIGRPELQRSSFELTAKGDIQAGEASLVAASGDAVSSTGSVRWQRDNGATTTTFKLSLIGPGLPDSPLAQLLRNEATLEGEATLDADGILTLRRTALAAGPARIGLSGRYDTAKDTLAATAEIDAAGPGPLAPLIGGATWRDLHATVRAELRDLAKRPTGTADVDLTANDVTAPGLDARVPKGQIAAKTRLALRPDGQIVVEALDLGTPLAKVVNGSGSFQPATNTGEVKATIDLPTLSSLSALAGTELTGRGRVDVTARLHADALQLSWQGGFDALGLPGVPADLLRSTLNVAGAVTLRQGDQWVLEDVRLSSEAASLRLDGRGQAQNGELKLALSFPRLALLQPGVEGDLSIDGTVAVEGAGLRGSAEAKGTVQGQPLALQLRFDRAADGALSVPSVQGSWASATVDVRALAITANGATGSGQLKVARLQDFAAMAGTELAGALQLDVSTDPEATGTVKLALRGDDLRGPGVGAGQVKVDATVKDPLGTAEIQAKVEATRLSGLQDISRVDATVKGNRTAIDLGLRLAGGQTNADLAARIEQAPGEIRVALSRLQARYSGIPVALAAPSRLAIQGERIALQQPLLLQLGAGRVRASGVVDPKASDLQAEITGLPLALLEPLTGAGGIEGTLQAKVQMRGPTASPRIDATYSAAGLRLRRPGMGLVPALALQGTATSADNQATFDLRVSAGTGTALTLRGKAGLPQGRAPLTAHVDVGGTLDLAPFAPLIGNDLRGVTGTLRPNLSIDIAGTQVTGRGTAILSGGGLYFPESGLRLAGGEALLSLEGDTLRLQRLGFQSGQGKLTGSGTVRLAPAQGFPVDLTIGTNRLLAVSRPDLVATLTSDVKITGSMVNGLDVSGRIRVDRAEISVGAEQSASFPTVAVREVNLPPGRTPAASAPRPAPRRPAAAKPPAAMAVRLALTVEAPQAVFVRGRGLDAEMVGQLRITGEPSAPIVLGTLTLRRGDFNLAGHRLVFTRGNVSLVTADTIDPLLDFVAASTVQGTTIEVAITGTARAPRIAVTSTPPLPQDEAMAVLLFGKPASSLSAFEILSAAQALAELSGIGPSGGGILARLRKGLGLDRLTVEPGQGTGSGAGGMTVGAGRYVAPGVYVGAKQGATDGSSRGVVEIEVLRNIKVEGDVGADSNGRVGIKMEWDY